MTTNPAANFPNLSNLTVQILAFTNSGSTVQNLAQTFLISYTESSYNAMVTAFNAALSTFRTGSNSSLRILLAIDDGTVAYDSSRGSANTFANFNSNTVNSSNHNTRPEILVAILGNSGLGISERFSRSVSAFQKYQATRLGVATQSNLGTFRISLDNII